jgi:hypothetical protein
MKRGPLSSVDVQNALLNWLSYSEQKYQHIKKLQFSYRTFAPSVHKTSHENLVEYVRNMKNLADYTMDLHMQITRSVLGDMEGVIQLDSAHLYLEDDDHISQFRGIQSSKSAEKTEGLSVRVSDLNDQKMNITLLLENNLTNISFNTIGSKL